MPRGKSEEVSPAARRVTKCGNADALEIRLAYYGNVINSAPGYNMQVALSA